MGAVLVEIGVEARHDWHPTPPHVSQDAQAQRRLGGDVDQVGPEGVDPPRHVAERWQGQVQLLVERQRHRAD
jgi:hypothetical protein